MRRRYLIFAAALGALLLVLRCTSADETAEHERSRRAARPAPTVTPAARAAAGSGAPSDWWLDAEPDGTGRLAGRVVDAAGAGVAGAEVSLMVPARTIVTGADGSFAFDRLLLRTYVVSAAKGELLAGPLTYQLTGQADPLVLYLGEAASAVVTVVDDAGHPIEGAEITSRVGAPVERAYRTAADGTARLAPLHPGWLGVEVSAPGYAPSIGTLSIGSPGAQGSLRVALRRGAAVSGRVVDETGSPLGAVRVTAVDPALGELASVHASSDAQGRFTLAALASGRYTLRAIDGEHAPATSALVTVTAGPVGGIEIVMTSGGTLAGTVVDAARRPVAFASVSVADGDPRAIPPESRRATTDAAGAFELRGLARRALRVSAESAVAASKVVSVDLSEHPDRDLELVLDADGMIGGAVVDEAGAPVPFVQVVAMPDLAAIAPRDAPDQVQPRFAIADGDGRFVVRGLPAGAYRLTATRRAGGTSGFGDLGPAGAPARTGDRSVQLKLETAGRITGRVAIAGSDALPRALEVMVRGQLPTPALDGAFELKDVAPGSYDVVFRSPEFGDVVQRHVVVVPGGTTDLGTVQATRGRAVTGKVVDAAGVPVSGAKVKVGRLDAAAPAQDAVAVFASMRGLGAAVSGPDGAFAIYGAPPVALSAVAYEPALGASAVVEVAGGAPEPAPIALRLPAPQR